MAGTSLCTCCACVLACCQVIRLKKKLKIAIEESETTVDPEEALRRLEEGDEDADKAIKGTKISLDKRLMAQRKKQQGKAAFLQENYLEAIALLTEASGADRFCSRW